MMQAFLFWLSVTLSVYCSLKAEKYDSVVKNDVLFLLASWPVFNLGVWQKYLATLIPEEFAFPCAALILIIISLVFIKRRGIALYGARGAGKDILCAVKWLALAAATLIGSGFFLEFIRWNPDTHSMAAKAADYFLWVAPTEELIFRGIIFALFNLQFRSRPSVVFTAVLFSLMPSHIAGQGIFPNWKYAGMAFVAGLFYGGSYRESKNVLVPMFLHGSVDTIWRICFN